MADEKQLKRILLIQNQLNRHLCGPKTVPNEFLLASLQSDNICTRVDIASALYWFRIMHQHHNYMSDEIQNYWVKQWRRVNMSNSIDDTYIAQTITHRSFQAAERMKIIEHFRLMDMSPGLQLIHAPRARDIPCLL